jgi:glycosyltransferase involved in cell wall biosynthesis
MNVLFLDHARTIVSGAELRLLDLVGALPGFGVTPFVACDPLSPLAARLREAGTALDAVVFPDVQAGGGAGRAAANARDVVRCTARLARVVRRRAIDVVHVNTLLPRLPGLLAARLTGRPVVWHVRDFVVQPLWRRLYRALARGVDRIVTVSDACRREFPGHPRMTTIPNGLDVKRWARPERDAARAALGVPAGAVAVGLVGLLEPWKGHEVLLHAAARLAGETPPVLVVVAGAESPKAPGFRAALARRAVALGLGDRLRLLAFTRDVPALLAALDVAVAPSLRPDPLPGAVLEAMAAGRPVVGTSTGGIPEMIVDERTGFLVAPGDAAALAARLRALRDAPGRRAAMGAAGRAVVEARFTLDASVRRLTEAWARA